MLIGDETLQYFLFFASSGVITTVHTSKYNSVLWHTCLMFSSTTIPYHNVVLLRLPDQHESYVPPSDVSISTAFLINMDG